MAKETPKCLIHMTDEDGTLMESWDIERDFGDIRKSFPASTMMDDIVFAFKRFKQKEGSK